jgi:hypothetical protein
MGTKKQHEQIDILLVRMVPCHAAEINSFLLMDLRGRADKAKKYKSYKAKKLSGY